MKKETIESVEFFKKHVTEKGQRIYVLKSNHKLREATYLEQTEAYIDWCRCNCLDFKEATSIQKFVNEVKILGYDFTPPKY